MKHHHHDSEHNVDYFDDDHLGGANRDDHEHVADPHHHHGPDGVIIYDTPATYDMICAALSFNELVAGWGVTLSPGGDDYFGPSDHDHRRG